MKDNFDQVETQYVTVSYLMKVYSMGRATVIRWVKDNEDVRYFQDEKFLRVNLADFEKLIESKVKSSRENQNATAEEEV